MLDLSIFSNRLFSAAAAAAFINGLSRFALLFVFVFYFKVVRGDTPIVAGVPNITRLADDNRYDTAVKVSVDTYASPPASGAVFLASGLAFPDALSASAVAGHLGAPLILVPGNQANLSSVPKVVAELTRLAPTHV
jgi:hypothetical protein